MMQLVFCLLGGFGLFMYGMNLMSDGLKQAAGSKIKEILNLLIKNRFAGVLLGLGITALIQSSSATTVFVVSFVNAGLLSLQQAIAVIMGANIGTTVTAWLVSFLAVFKITNYALPAIGLGFFVHVLARQKKTTAWGQTILGFGLLFLGLSFMKDAFEPFQDHEGVKQFLQILTANPIAGVFAGIVVTVLLQSSSATIAMAQIMAFGGMLSLPAAICLILGNNIGTTITAQIAAWQTNKTARQAAMAHTIFNVFGVACALPFVWQGSYGNFVEWLTPGQLSTSTVMIHIAVAHSVFNIINTVICLPFVNLLTTIVIKITPARQGELDIVNLGLDERLLETPALAIEQSTQALAKMLGVAEESLRQSLAYFMGDKSVTLKMTRDLEEQVDHLRNELIHYLSRLMEQELSAQMAETVALLIHGVNDVERVGDRAVNIAEQAELATAGQLCSSPQACSQLSSMMETVWEMIEKTKVALQQNSSEAARQALGIDSRLDDFKREFHRSHLKRLRGGKCSVKAESAFIAAVDNMEKVGDHLRNINQAIIANYHLPS